MRLHDLAAIGLATFEMLGNVHRLALRPGWLNRPRLPCQMRPATGRFFMGEDILLKSAAGDIAAYLATPKGTAKGGIVVVQEIFGVHHHIRAVTDKFAADG